MIEIRTVRGPDDERLWLDLRNRVADDPLAPDTRQRARVLRGMYEVALEAAPDVASPDPLVTATFEDWLRAAPDPCELPRPARTLISRACARAATAR